MIRTVGILGAGQMGNGIAHLFAQHLYEVTLFDIDDAQLLLAVAVIRRAFCMWPVGVPPKTSRGLGFIMY
jgi:3-hydroxyacyl-CoA dehydrogenase